MTLPEILILGTVVSINDFAVALGLGASGVRNRPWKIALVFAGLGFLFPLAGLLIGATASGVLAERATAVAVGLVGGFGLWVLLRSIGAPPRSRRWRDARIPKLALILLAVGVSVDNLVVGLALGLHGLSPLGLALAIACAVFLWSLLGITVGRSLHLRWELPARRTAGVLLIGVGAAMAMGWV